VLHLHAGMPAPVTRTRRQRIWEVLHLHAGMAPARATEGRLPLRAARRESPRTRTAAVFGKSRPRKPIPAAAAHGTTPPLMSPTARVFAVERGGVGTGETGRKRRTRRAASKGRFFSSVC
jgi:hypothetical protein